MINLVVLASGNGSNLQAIIDAINNNILVAKISLVVSNNPDSYALVRAQKNNIPTFLLSFDNNDRREYERILVNEINKFSPDLIVLAGWMQVVTSIFINSFKNIINLHPALPGQFPGANGIRDAFKSFQLGKIKHTGVMCHRVIEKVDSGEVLATTMVPCEQNDTLETLTTRVQKYEKGVLIEGIQKCLNEKMNYDIESTKKISYNGKVRNVIDIGYDTLLLEASDRLSAYDTHRCNIPSKGDALNMMSAWWLNETSHIIPNHYLFHNGKYMFVKKTTPIKLEIVVRGYMTGSTSTSIWPMYQKGERLMYGIQFPDGLKKNQKLDTPIITPTTKGETDYPITREEIISQGFLNKSQCDFIYNKALHLFEYGQYVAAQKGLILVDTKYEFGFDTNGNIILIDEVHTCDSSRYWLKDTYLDNFNMGKEPNKFDKDLVRDWIKKNTSDPYKENPEIPEEIINGVSNVYIKYAELLYNSTDIWEPWNFSRDDIVERYLGLHSEYRVEIIAGSISDKKHVEKIKNELEKLNIYSHITYSSAHKNTQHVVDLINTVNKDFSKVVWVTVAGRSNALSGVVAANSVHPVIGCPPFADKMDMMVNINSTLQCPSKVPVMTILEPGNVAICVKRIFKLN